MLKTLVTGVDNESLDVGRISCLVGITCFCCNSCWIVYNTKLFDMQGFGIGFAAILGGVGALLKLKENSEPPKGTVV